MKSTHWALLALLLLALPNARAESAPASQTEMIGQVSATRLHVAEQLDWSSGSSDPTVARFQAPPALSNLTVTLWSGGRAQPIPASAVQKTGPMASGLDLYRADLSSGQVAQNGSFTVYVEYDVTGTSVKLATTYDVARLTVFVSHKASEAVTSDYFTQWIPIDYRVEHATRNDVPANQTYTFSFQAAPTAPSQDRTPILWGVLGLVAGIVLMLIGVRMGWVASRPQKAKFEKGGASEARTMLEARRRTLLAALKELEHAHEAKEIPDDAYAPLKEEYKAQAVRVMRNLEEKKEG